MDGWMKMCAGCVPKCCVAFTWADKALTDIGRRTSWLYGIGFASRRRLALGRELVTHTQVQCVGHIKQKLATVVAPQLPFPFPFPFPFPNMSS